MACCGWTLGREGLVIEKKGKEHGKINYVDKGFAG